MQTVTAQSDAYKIALQSIAVLQRRNLSQPLLDRLAVDAAAQGVSFRLYVLAYRAGVVF